MRSVAKPRLTVKPPRGVSLRPSTFRGLSPLDGLRSKRPIPYEERIVMVASGLPAFIQHRIRAIAKEQDASATITAAHLVSRGASILWSEWPVLHTLQTEQDALREARDPDDGAWLDAWHYRAFEGAAILNKEGREEKFKLSRDEARPVKALIALGLTTNSVMALCLMAVLIAIPDRPDVNGAMRRELKRFRDAATARLSEAQTRRNARARERVTLVTSSLDDV